MKATRITGVGVFTALLLAGGWLFSIPSSQAQQDDQAQKASQAETDSDDKEDNNNKARHLDNPLAAERYAQQAAGADASSVESLIGKGSDNAWACASCHGDQDQGAQNIPRLAGLPAGYLTKQLHDYAAERRLNNNMQYVVEDLSNQQMAALGKHYAQMDAPSNTSPDLGGDLDRGRELALQGDWSLNVPACFSCHGSSAWGVGQAFPALAAQHPSYTYAQLVNWKSGRRANSPVKLMYSVSKALSDADMRAVADYLASLPAPPKQQPVVSATQGSQSQTSFEAPSSQ